MKEAFKYSFVLFILFIGTASSQAQIDIALFYDSLSHHTANSITETNWTPYDIGSDIRYGFNENATVWCRIKLEKSQLSKDDYLCFNNNHLDSIVIYNGDAMLMLGDRTNKRSIFVADQSFPISQLPDSIWFYAKVKKGLSFIDFSIDIKRNDQLMIKSNQIIAVGFLYLGVTLLLIMVNVFLWFQKREKRFVYYITYSIIGVIYVFVNLGLMRYVLPIDFVYTSEIRIYSGSFWFLMLGYFIVELLNLKVISPLGFRLFDIISKGTILLAVSGIVLLTMKWYQWIWLPSFISYILFFVMLGLVAYGSLLSIRLRNRMGYYVLLSFFPHSIWALSIILVAFNVVNLGVKVDWIGIIMLYETVLFGWILFSEYIEAFKKNNQLKEQIIASDKNLLELTDKIRLKERKQLASLLHDKFGIDIANTVHLIEVNRNDDARLALTNLGKDLRELSHTILPVSLKDGALIDAVRSQVQILNNQQQELRINFNAFDFPELVPEELAFMMYLSTLELIQNAIKHSGAKEMDVEFFGYKNELVFSYSDDGVGFNTITEKGFGIANIENRVNEKGGQLSWSSNEHSGTQLLISIPSDYQ